MALREAYQSTISADTLYEVHKLTSGDEQLRRSLECVVGSGTVNVYGSNKLPVSAPTGMTLTASGLSGIAPFDVIPNYLYVETATDVPELILSGVEAKAV